MSEYCVVVADSSRARFFTLEDARVPEVESGPNLVEHSDLVDPEVAVPGRENFSEAKSGRNMPRGGPAHGYDDHRDRHVDERDRRFARRIADTAIDQVYQHGARRLVLSATSRMLGFLREALSSRAGNRLEIREIAKDLAGRGSVEIHRHLSEAGLLPGREDRAPARWQRSAGPGSGANWSG